ncbi:MAG: hypothetical protein PV358_01565 [Acidimicrobiales bacterium]|nr:hypothetical protein [Acidimicrobiales bacterium]
MFPFTSYEATRMLVDDHIAELRRGGRRRPPTGNGRPHPGRADADSRSRRRIRR